MEFPEKVTIGQKYDPIVKIKTKEGAAAYLEMCIRHTMRFGKSRQEAERVERMNIGYYAGYYDIATQKRINQLFGVTHPILGDIRPSFEEAFDAGAEIALGIRPTPK